VTKTLIYARCCLFFAGSSAADLVFVFLVACYTMMTLANNAYIQQCTGVLIVFSLAISVSIHCPPEIAYDMAASLKGIWVFAEVVLFTLTGASLTFDSSNGPLYGQRGLSSSDMETVVVLIVLGLIGRFVSLGISMALIYPSLPPHRREPKWIGAFWINNFIFMLPKSTVQATMGGVAYATQLIPGPQGVNKGKFIVQATAFAVLICAPLGSILTKTVGAPLALYIANLDKEAGWRIKEGRYSHKSKFFDPDAHHSMIDENDVEMADITDHHTEEAPECKGISAMDALHINADDMDAINATADDSDSDSDYEDHQESFRRDQAAIPVRRLSSAELKEPETIEETIDELIGRFRSSSGAGALTRRASV
jgi:hypothetical protein